MRPALMDIFTNKTATWPGEDGNLFPIGFSQTETFAQPPVGLLLRTLPFVAAQEKALKNREKLLNILVILFILCHSASRN